MRQKVAIHSLGQEYLPHTTLPTVKTQLRALPRVEVTKDEDILGLGQPLTEPPPLERIVPLPAVVAVAIGIINDRRCLSLDGVHTLKVALVTIPHLIGYGLQPLIGGNHGQYRFYVLHREKVSLYTNIRFFCVSLSKLL